jgi:hypothetical protein
MNEGFKIFLCLALVLGPIGEFCLFPEEDIFPHWMYAIIGFYGVLLWIDERLVPVVKDVADLFKNGS